MPGHAGRYDYRESRTEWRIGVGVGSHHGWHHPAYHGWPDRRYARYNTSHRYRSHWHYDPWYWRDPFYGPHRVSVGWTVPLVRHSDTWTQRAVPRQVAPPPPTAGDRARASFAEQGNTGSPSQPVNAITDDEEQRAQDGAVLAGQGLAALQRQQTAEAVALLRQAFAQDPHNARLAAQDPALRSTCAALRESLLHRFPYELTSADRQFLHAVLHFYAGDLPSASYAAQMLRDELPSTVQLRRAVGAS